MLTEKAGASEQAPPTVSSIEEFLEGGEEVKIQQQAKKMFVCNIRRERNGRLKMLEVFLA